VQPGDDVFQAVGREGERVAAAQEHVAHSARLAHVGDGGVDLLLRAGPVRLAGEAPPGAVPAVHADWNSPRALVGDQQQHPVRIAVGQARRG